VSSGNRDLLRAFGAAFLGLAAIAGGQENALTLPPRIDASPRDAELAPPAPGRREALEEIIVVGESEWRLPDLGSEWRARADEESEAERIEVSFLPLYDPERDPIDYDPLQINREIQRVGFIELFRVEFGSARE
jgi:hypothetical protein